MSDNILPIHATSCMKILLNGVTDTETLNWTVISPISPSAVCAMICSVCGPASNLERSMDVSRAPTWTESRHRVSYVS